MKPDQAKIHTFLFERLEDKNKTFPSKEGQRKKFIIHFQNGYSAEWCPLMGLEGLAKLWEPGEKITFKIRFRKDFGDEIELVTADQVKEEEKVGAAPTAKGNVFNMHGHPASIALMAAKEIHVTKMNNANKSEYAELMLSDMLEEADTIHDWLTKKVVTD